MDKNGFSKRKNDKKGIRKYVITKHHEVHEMIKRNWIEKGDKNEIKNKIK